MFVIPNNKHFLFNSVSINKDTICLTQKQIAEVFDVNVLAISKHIKNIYKNNELEEFGTVSVLEIVPNEIQIFSNIYLTLNLFQ